MEATPTSGLVAFIIQLVPLTILCVVLLIPYIRIFKRIGRSPWWSLLVFIPMVGIFAVPWVVAFMRWERQDHLTSVFE